MKLKFLILISLFAVVFFSCKKDDSSSSSSTTTITGLWNGTYTWSGSSNPISFSVLSDGTFSYRGKGQDGKIYFHDGTWTLTGTNFVFNVVTVNATTVKNLTGTVTFNSTDGTLTGGTICDAGTGLNCSSFSVTKVK